MTKQKFQQQSWRWFGFDTETTGLNVEKDCVIQFAAYDLESGASYTALVNPAYHKPRYVFSTEAYRVHGEPKQQQTRRQTSGTTTSKQRLLVDTSLKHAVRCNSVSILAFVRLSLVCDLPEAVGTV